MDEVTQIYLTNQSNIDIVTLDINAIHMDINYFHDTALGNI